MANSTARSNSTSATPSRTGPPTPRRRAAGRAQRAVPGLGRHRHRHLGLLRRTRRDARDEPDRRARSAAVAVPHHRAVLADPGLAADRTQRHHGRHGHHRGVHRRLPQLQRPHPDRHRAAVGGARRTRLQHLLRRQVAPDPARGVQSGCHQTALAAESRGFERFYGFMGGETDQWYPGAGLRQPPRRPARHPGGRLPPVEGPGRQDHRVHPRRQGDRTRQAVVQLPVPRRGARAAPRLQGVGRQVRRHASTWATRPTARSCWRTRRSSASSRRTPNCRLSTRISTSRARTANRGRCRTPSGRGTRSNDEEKRLFSRMAEVFAGFLSYTDAQIGRVLDYLEESGQLDNTIIVVISDNGASGEGGPNGSVNEVKFFNGYIDTVEESMRFYDQLGGPETYNHYPDRLGDGVQHAVQAVQALRLARGRHRRHRNHLLAQRNRAPTARCATTTSTSATSPRRSTTCWASPRPTRSRASRRSRSTASVSRRR